MCVAPLRSFSSARLADAPPLPFFAHADINIPIFIVLFVGWKVAKRTQFWKPHEMDFVTGIPTVEETEVPEVPPVTLAQKIAAVLF